MKNKIIFLLIIFLFTGCYNYREINNLAITTAIGIDKEDDDFVLTIQVVNIQKEGSEASGSSNETKFITYETKGKSLYEAIRSVILESPKMVYGSHLQLIVIGQEVAKEGISQIFDFFMRNPESRKQFQMVLARESNAKDILKVLTPFETLNSRNIIDSINSDAKYLGVAEKIVFEEQVKTYLNGRKDMVMTSIKLVGNPEQSETTETLKETNPKTRLLLSGIGVFRKDKLQGYLTEDESIAAGFLNNTINNSVIKFECEKNKYITINVMKPKTEIKFDDNKIKISVKTDGSINEVGCNMDLNNNYEISKIEEMSEKEISKNINNLLDRTRNELKVDSFGLLDLIYKSNPKYSYKLIDNWYDRYLQELNIQVEVSVSLTGKGNIITVIPSEEN